MNTTAAGKRAEAKVRADLTDNGYSIVTSHLSRGAADMVAAKPAQRLVVQVKRSLRSGGGVAKDEWNALIDLAEAWTALPIVAVASPRAEICYFELTGRKDGSRRRQPWRPFVLDQITQIERAS